MKILDIIAMILLIIGGLNWGLIGAVNFNVIEVIFGSAWFITRLIYLLVGISAIYQIVQLRKMQKRGKKRA